MQLTPPTLSSPADGPTATNVVYTITSTSTGDDKLVLNIGSANFTYQSVSVGTASKVGNTVECIGFTTNNPAVTIQFTAQATYSVTAKAINIAGTYGTSADSAADSITIANSIEATGGTESTYTYDSVDYVMHTFKTHSAPENLVITSAPAGKTIDVLVVAGGGGGGGGRWAACSGGGGGGGGLRWFTAQAPTASTYVATVGGGGAGGNATYGAKGGDSSFIGSGISITGTGGGGGERNHAGHASQHGGSGGGASSNDTGQYGHQGLGNTPSTTPPQGYNGQGPIAPVQNGHGGGGAGGVPPNAASGTQGGDGGVGEDNFLNQSSVAFTVAATKALLDAADNNNGLGEVSGSNRYMAGGGGGGFYTHLSGSGPGDGGLGGAGNGGNQLGTSQAGDANTGGAGGGGGGSGVSNPAEVGSNGGSGVVIVRYLA
jgi:hypothetical protein